MRTTLNRSLGIGVITLFPEMFQSLHFGITGRAIANGLISLSLWDLRHFSTDKHQTVDDRPYGGGPGMVLKLEPLCAAIKAAKAQLTHKPKCVYLSPQGKQINHSVLTDFIASEQSLLLIAGRYEGIDERVIETDVDEEWSLGDLVLSGGEIPAMAVIDGLARLIPGALGCAQSSAEDSFADGLLDHPHYTRPQHSPDGRSVPEVLVSGDHQAIKEWRLKQALGRTYLKRPELLAQRCLTEKEKKLLTEFKLEYQRSMFNGEHY